MDSVRSGSSACRTCATRPRFAPRTIAFCRDRCRAVYHASPGATLSPFFEGLAVRLRIVRSIALNDLRPGSQGTAFAADARDLVQQGKQLRDVVTIRFGKDSGQRDSVCVSE